MPSVAEEHPRLMAPGKKRRRDNDNDLHIQGPLYEKLAQYSAVASNNWNADGPFGGRPVQQQLQQQANLFPRFPGNDRMIFQHGGPGVVDEQHHNYDAVPRKIAPLPVPKRQRMFDEDADTDIWGTTETTTSPQRQRRHSKSPPSQQQSRALQDQTDAGNRPKAPSSLSPCHICHRRPTKKSDLDSFADCEGCGQRTCFVCLRECQGWQKDGRPSNGDEAEQDLSRSFHMKDVDDERQQQQLRNEGQKFEHDAGTRGGQDKQQDGWAGSAHQQKVCSRCCIEKGAEGDIVCLGCLSRMESV